MKGLDEILCVRDVFVIYVQPDGRAVQDDPSRMGIEQTSPGAHRHPGIVRMGPEQSTAPLLLMLSLFEVGAKLLYVCSW